MGSVQLLDYEAKHVESLYIISEKQADMFRYCRKSIHK